MELEKNEIRSCQEQTPKALITSELEYLEVNDVMAMFHRRDRDEIVGTPCAEYLPETEIETGQLFQECLSGCCDSGCTTTIKFRRGDGTVVEDEVELKRVVVDGEDCILATVIHSEEIEQGR
jgi:hypothetical protein